MFSYLCRKITFKQLVFTKLIFVFTFGWVKKTNQQFHREQLTTEILNSEASNWTKSKYYVWNSLHHQTRTVIWTSEKTSQHDVYSRLLWFVAIIYDVIFKTRRMCFCDCSYTTGGRGAVSPVSSANRKTGGRKRISQKRRDCARAFKHAGASALNAHADTFMFVYGHFIWAFVLLCLILNSKPLPPHVSLLVCGSAYIINYIYI